MFHGTARGMKAILAVSATLIGLTLGGKTAAYASPFDKLNHIIVMMQENRSFDHYFGRLNNYDPSLGVEAEPKTGNPDPNGAMIAPFHQTHYCEVADLDHSWTGTHNEWDNGNMDGFAKQNVDVTADPTGSRAMGYYDETDLPFYYSLYDTFAISDTYFSSVLDQTFPNRFYLLSGTSFGHIRNDFPFPPTYSPLTDFSQPSIFEKLDDASITWKIYFNEVPFAWLYAYGRLHSAGHVFPITQYFVDAAAGLLPQVAFVDPIFLGTVNVENDEHPPTNIQNGQLLVANVVNALFLSPNWSDSALLITYDEHGGYYDHLPPPKAPLPDGIVPMVQTGDAPGAFDQLGIRVPFVVVSPWARKHYVSSALPLSNSGTLSDPVYTKSAHIYSHTSVLRTIEERFGLPTLTARDAASNDFADLFDFTKITANFATPPTLAPATIDPQHLIDCETREHAPTGF